MPHLVLYFHFLLYKNKKIQIQWNRRLGWRVDLYFNIGTNLPLSVTEKTKRKPSPVLMYCSLIAPNSSCPAVSRTKEKTTHVTVFVFSFYKWRPHKGRRSSRAHHTRRDPLSTLFSILRTNIFSWQPSQIIFIRTGWFRSSNILAYQS